MGQHRSDSQRDEGLAPGMLSSIPSTWPAPSMLFGAADGARRPSEDSDGLPPLATSPGKTHHYE